MKEKFQVVRLAEGDVRCKSDHLADFRTLILANERMYPEIERWYCRRVLPGIRQEERVAFVGYLEQRPVVSAVIKKGANAKFCHLRIQENLQDDHLGEIFFSLMALEIRDLARTVHFTLPESLWTSKGEFFKSFGFSAAQPAETQYRLFDKEFTCSAAFTTVWSSVLAKVPKLSRLYSFGGFSEDGQLLLSVKPEYADKILRRTKRVELRRKFSTRWLGHRINIYASTPVMSLVGEARISSIVQSNPEAIWDRFHIDIGCTRAEFDTYTTGADDIYAIVLDDVRPYREALPLAQMSSLLREELVPPQSYLQLEKNKPWAKAISLAAYLHGCFRSSIAALRFDLSEGRTSTQQKGAPIPPPTQEQFTFSDLHRRR